LDCCSFLLRGRARPGSTLFPYTTLFRSYTNRERIERWNDLYGYRSRWSTGLVGFSGPLVEVPIQKFGPDRGQYRPDIENRDPVTDRKSTRLNSSHVKTSYAVVCLKKKHI